METGEKMFTSYSPAAARWNSAPYLLKEIL
jgi:hypothetical protein